MAEKATFKCLRCGHEFLESYDPKIMKERSCPKCASNSIRRMKGK